MRDEKEIKNLLVALRAAAPGRVHLAATMLYRGRDRARLARSKDLAREAGVPSCPSTTCIITIPAAARSPTSSPASAEAGHRSRRRAPCRQCRRFLKPGEEMARLFRDAPEAIEETLRLDEQLAFLARRTALRISQRDHRRLSGRASGADASGLRRRPAKRYPAGRARTRCARLSSTNCPDRTAALRRPISSPSTTSSASPGRRGRLLPGPRLGREFGRLPRRHRGRPRPADLLFERFISPRGAAPAPDIDVDFEHEQREEVMQYIYEKYGRDRAGMTADRHHLSLPLGRPRRRQGLRPDGDTVGALSALDLGRRSGGVRRRGLSSARPRSRETPHAARSRRYAGARSPASRATSPSMSAASSSPASRLDEVVPIGTRPCPIAPSSNGTRTTSTRSASSRSTCWPWACSRASARRSIGWKGTMRRVRVPGTAQPAVMRCRPGTQLFANLSWVPDPITVRFATRCPASQRDRHTLRTITIPDEDPAVYRMLRVPTRSASSRSRAAPR